MSASETGDAPYPGDKLHTLLDGSMVWSNDPRWIHEIEARSVAKMPQHDRDSYLAAIMAARGEEEAERLRKTIDEVIAVEAGRAR